jgi:hypothetical protein
MKLFGFEFKKFDTKPSVVESVEPVQIHRFEEQTTKAEVVELWIVKWYPLVNRYTYTEGSYEHGKLNHLAFTSKDAANEYAEQLRKALKLLGDRNRTVTVERQNNPTNV